MLLVGALCWQAALAGHAVWMSRTRGACGRARRRRRAATRSAAARSALPAALERGLSVERLNEGGVRVRVRVPFLMPRWRSPATVSATASLGRGER